MLQVRRWRQQLVTRSIAKSDAAWDATKTPSQGEEGIDAYIYKKRTPVWMSFLIKVAMAHLALAFAVPAAHDRRGGLTARRKKSLSFSTKALNKSGDGSAIP